MRQTGETKYTHGRVKLDKPPHLQYCYFSRYDSDRLSYIQTGDGSVVRNSNRIKSELNAAPDGVVPMRSLVKVSEAIARIAKKADTTELKEAVDDFLASYGELRSQLIYLDPEAKANAKIASSMLEAVDRGLIELPQTDDGIVIIPDMLIRLPDGARLYVDSIEIESTATGRAPILHLEDGAAVRCRRGSGIQIARMPAEENRPDEN